MTPEAAYVAAVDAMRAHDAKREQLATVARKAAAKLLKLENCK